MIRKFYFTGDLHRDFSRCFDFNNEHQDERVGLIVLGDAGINVGKRTDDFYFKRSLQKKYPNIEFYLVRGNHEERPENVNGMCCLYDVSVDGHCYIEPMFPHIHYFKDGETYIIEGKKILVLGGAYSIDKYYRIEHGWSWFPSEQLTTEERDRIFNKIKDNNFDIVLSHTCPIDWEPTDLFLPYVSQHEVDKSMENWLQEVKENIKWKLWLFGHYHDDRIERPHVEMLYKEIQSLSSIWERWENYNKTNTLQPFYLRKSPYFYMT